MNTELQPGQKVLISFDPKDHFNGNPAKKFNGTEAIIKTRKVLMYGIRHLHYGIYYELEGITSEYGIPYVFLEDHLIPLKN